MKHARHSEGAFETVIEATMLDNGAVPEPATGYDRDRAIFPDAILNFIRDTQPKEWKALEALHGEKTGAQILSDLTKWMDREGSGPQGQEGDDDLSALPSA
jgi:type I restriction enzyme R subunit